MNKPRLSLRLNTLHSVLAMALLAGLTGPIAAHDSDAPSEQITFAIIGDSGSGTRGQFDVAKQMEAAREKSGFDFVLMLGDNIYPDGSSKFYKARFEEPYKNLLKAGVKFYPALGNHDVTHGATTGTSYSQFEMKGRRYYSFVKGGGLVQFFALDSTNMRADQLTWFEKELAESTAKWKIVYLHHPIYCSARRHGGDKSLRGRLEPILVRYRVDAVFAGHDHVYERMKPQQGIYYFTEGASGQLRKGNINRTATVFENGNDQMCSFLLVSASSKGIKVEAIGGDGSALDSITIPKTDKVAAASASQ